jgi:hypothetical protein
LPAFTASDTRGCRAESRSQCQPTRQMISLRQDPSLI